MDIGAIIIALALLVLTIPFLASPFMRQKSKQVQKEAAYTEPLEERRAVLLAVRELDFDYKTGKVDEGDYTNMRSQLMSKAASLTPPVNTSESPILPDPSKGPESLTRQKSCPSCKSRLQAGDLYCVSCGTSLSRFCPSCGKKVPIDANFCSSCGQEVLEKLIS